MLTLPPYRRDGSRSLTIILAVILLHLALLYAVLQPVKRLPNAMQPIPTRAIAINIIPYPRLHLRQVPRISLTLAAPPAPYVPPPEIRTQTRMPAIATTTSRTVESSVGVSAALGNGVAMRGGQALPPSPPIYLTRAKPDYPAIYRHARIEAFVAAVCIVEVDGSADRCRIVYLDGRPAFGDAVLAWLGAGNAHYKPATRDGRPIAQSAALKFDFIPKGQEN